MKKMIFLIAGLLISLATNAQAGKNTSKIEFESYESSATTNFILGIFNLDYDSILIQKYASIDLYNDSTLLKTFPKDYFSDLSVDSFHKMSIQEKSEIFKILRNKSNYVNGRYNKNGTISYSPCSEPQRYDILMSMSKGKNLVLKLLFSSDSHRFCVFYQSDRAIFILYDSCINDIGWDRINKFLGPILSAVNN